MLPVERLDAIIARAKRCRRNERRAAAERFVELSKEYAEIDPLVGAIKTYRAALANAKAGGSGCRRRRGNGRTCRH